MSDYRQTSLFRDWLLRPHSNPEFVCPGWLHIHDAFNFMGSKLFEAEWTGSELRAVSGLERAAILASICREMEQAQASIETADTDRRNRPSAVEKGGSVMSHKQLVKRAISAAEERVATLTAKRAAMPAADDEANLRRSGVWGPLRRFLTGGTLPAAIFDSGTGKLHPPLKPQLWAAESGYNLFCHGRHPSAANPPRWIVVPLEQLDQCLVEAAEALVKKDQRETLISEPPPAVSPATGKDASPNESIPKIPGHRRDTFDEYVKWEKLSTTYENKGSNKIGAADLIRTKLKLFNVEAEYIARMVREIRRKRKTGIIPE